MRFGLSDRFRPVLIKIINQSVKKDEYIVKSYLHRSIFLKLQLYEGQNIISPVHLVWDLESLHLIQSLYFFSKISKKLQVLDQAHFKKIYNDWISQHLYFFFENEKILVSKKITTMGSQHHLNPIVVIFLEIKFFSFPKKITSVG